MDKWGFRPIKCPGVAIKTIQQNPRPSKTSPETPLPALSPELQPYSLAPPSLLSHSHFPKERGRTGSKTHSIVRKPKRSPSAGTQKEPGNGCRKARSLSESSLVLSLSHAGTQHSWPRKRQKRVTAAALRRRRRSWKRQVYQVAELLYSLSHSLWGSCAWACVGDSESRQGCWCERGHDTLLHSRLPEESAQKQATENNGLIPFWLDVFIRLLGVTQKDASLSEFNIYSKTDQRLKFHLQKKASYVLRKNNLNLKTRF